jgi:hypothetical protein
MTEILLIVVAFVAGTVSPAIGRKLKALFSKEEAAAVTAVKADIPKL